MSPAASPARRGDRAALAAIEGRGRRPPTPGRLARRRWAVRLTKYVLPVLALGLLSSIAVWPELTRTLEHGRVTFHRLTSVAAGSGTMVQPRYRGRDERNRPYMVSADTADQAGPDRINLTAPKGDLALADGGWLMVRAERGVFMQHKNQLDLAGNVVLYRQDGTMMTSASATLDLKQGAGAGNEPTHVEGPFGTLDAEGFTSVDKGGLIQFQGPAKLVLNGTH